MKMASDTDSLTLPKNKMQYSSPAGYRLKKKSQIGSIVTSIETMRLVIIMMYFMIHLYNMNNILLFQIQEVVETYSWDCEEDKRSWCEGSIQDRGHCTAPRETVSVGIPLVRNITYRLVFSQHETQSPIQFNLKKLLIKKIIRLVQVNRMENIKACYPAVLWSLCYAAEILLLTYIILGLSQNICESHLELFLPVFKLLFNLFDRFVDHCHFSFLSTCEAESTSTNSIGGQSHEFRTLLDECLLMQIYYYNSENIKFYENHKTGQYIYKHILATK